MNIHTHIHTHWLRTLALSMTSIRSGTPAVLRARASVRSGGRSQSPNTTTSMSLTAQPKQQGCQKRKPRKNVHQTQKLGSVQVERAQVTNKQCLTMPQRLLSSTHPHTHPHTHTHTHTHPHTHTHTPTHTHTHTHSRTLLGDTTRCQNSQTQQPGDKKSARENKRMKTKR